jgi:aldose sugar dehydrogenase
MKRVLLYVLSALGLLSLVGLITLTTLIVTNVLTPDKIAVFIKFNPLLTAANPEQQDTSIEANLVRLKATKFSLPSMGQGFENGGGAIAEVAGGVLVAERSGRFFYFDLRAKVPMLRLTKIAIDINEPGFERFAQAQGYDVRPGTNVGFAGLGMRLHDLLVLRDGNHILASYTHWSNEQNCATEKVVIADFAQGGELPEAGPWKQVFETKPCLQLSGYKNKPFAGHQAGGRMVEEANGKILLTIGDFKNDGVKRDLSVADLNNDYGKIHEIDLTTGASEIFTSGHRNPQGLTIANDGTIWSTEHGPSGGDEINIIVKDTNYGWPQVTLGHDCDGCDWQLEGRHDGFTPPVFSYTPSLGISNLVQLHNFTPLWDGDLLVASMAAQTLHHLRLNGHLVQFDEPIPMGDRLRDMIQLADGRVAIWTDSGRLIFLSEDKELSFADKLAADLSTPAKDMLQQCKGCHDLNSGQGRQGKISLWQIEGRGRGALEGAIYSPAMKAIGGTWTHETLDLFLKNPQQAVSGTTMPLAGIEDAAHRKELVDFLAKLR